MASQKQQYTILYGRLSQEDERAGESNSILHQRELLESYAQAKGFENTLFLADDGYSGTNFDRPSWKKIIEMIEAGAQKTTIKYALNANADSGWKNSKKEKHDGQAADLQGRCARNRAPDIRGLCCGIC